MEIQLEQLASAGLEMHHMIRDYYKRTNAQDGIPPLRMDWSFYGKLEKQNKLVIVTARDGYDLVGFAMYILGEHPQHDAMPFALCNTLAVDVDHRGQGIGTQLVQAAESYFKTTPVKMIVHGHRTVYDAAPLFPKLGFNLIEHIYMKEI